MGDMTLGEAWLVFGKDAREVLLELGRHPKQDRIALSKQMLEEAKRVAKKLMVKHHPDRGGDAKKFVQVQVAISALEKHTSEFEEKMKEAIRKAEEKALKSNRVLIKIG